MGKMLSVASRKAKNFNVENRAHKIISMDKPVAAPKHPSSQKEMDLLMKGSLIPLIHFLFYLNCCTTLIFLILF